MKRSHIVCFLLLFGLGCVHIQSHPDSWRPEASKTSPEDCLNISGVYANAGEGPKGGPVKLANWLNLNTDHNPQHANENNALWHDLSDASSVELNLSENGVLTIIAKGPIKSRTWSYEKSKRQLECKNGILTVHFSGDGSGDGVAAFESNSLELQRVGNDLVVNRVENAFGFMLFIPAWGHESLWGRFKPWVNP